MTSLAGAIHVPAGARLADLAPVPPLRIRRATAVTFATATQVQEPSPRERFGDEAAELDRTEHHKLADILRQALLEQPDAPGAADCVATLEEQLVAMTPPRHRRAMVRALDEVYSAHEDDAAALVAVLLLWETVQAGNRSALTAQHTHAVVAWALHVLELLRDEPDEPTRWWRTRVGLVSLLVVLLAVLVALAAQQRRPRTVSRAHRSPHVTPLTGGLTPNGPPPAPVRTAAHDDAVTAANRAGPQEVTTTPD